MCVDINLLLAAPNNLFFFGFLLLFTRERIKKNQEVTTLRARNEGNFGFAQHTRTPLSTQHVRPWKIDEIIGLLRCCLIKEFAAGVGTEEAGAHLGQHLTGNHFQSVLQRVVDADAAVEGRQLHTTAPKENRKTFENPVVELLQSGELTRPPTGSCPWPPRWSTACA